MVCKTSFSNFTGAVLNLFNLNLGVNSLILFLKSRPSPVPRETNFETIAPASIPASFKLLIDKLPLLLEKFSPVLSTIKEWCPKTGRPADKFLKISI